MARVFETGMQATATRFGGLGRWANDGRVRGWLAQIACVAVVAAIGWFFAANANSNLARNAAAFGFGFLTERTGIEVSFSLIEYSASSSYARLLLVGLLNTFFVSIFAILLAALIGVAVGIGRLSRNWLLAALSTAYVELIRNIPLLLFVLACYFAALYALPGPRESLSLAGAVFLNNRGLFLPAPLSAGLVWGVPVVATIGAAAALVFGRWSSARQDRTGRALPSATIGAGLVVAPTALMLLAAIATTAWELPALRGFNLRGGVSVIPEFVALLAALSLYTGAFIAEIVRGGLLAVPDGQRQAAAALGLSRGQILRLVIIPQALRVMIPPLTSQFVNVVKNSSYAAAIAYPEIVSVFVGSALNNTGRAIEIIAITMAIYLAINLVVSVFMNWFNARMAIVVR